MTLMGYSSLTMNFAGFPPKKQWNSLLSNEMFRMLLKSFFESSGLKFYCLNEKKTFVLLALLIWSSCRGKLWTMTRGRASDTFWFGRGSHFHCSLLIALVMVVRTRMSALIISSSRRATSSVPCLCFYPLFLKQHRWKWPMPPQEKQHKSEAGQWLPLMCPYDPHR